MAVLRRKLRRARAWLGRPKMQMQDRIITISDLVPCPNPIFLIGLHRSGTSLMRRVLNSHPAIACPPETFYMQHYAAMLDDDTVVAGYRGFGNDIEMMTADLARKASALHEAFRTAQGKPRWADKTPQYTAILPQLKRMFGPGVRFVMLYRHPFDVADSIRRRGWDLTGTGHYDFGAMLTHMRRQYDLQIAFERDNPDLCCRSFYEDLTADPQARITGLMAALGETFDPAQLDHHKAQHNFGTEDPIARGLQGFTASSGNWTDWSMADHAAAIAALGPVCDMLGYATARDAAQARVPS